MKIHHILFDAQVAKSVGIIKKSLNSGDILVVSPSINLQSRYDEILNRQLVQKLDAEQELKALFTQLKELTDDASFSKMADQTMEKVYDILCQGMSIGFQDDSLIGYLRNYLIGLCAWCMQSLLGEGTVTDGRELIVCEGNREIPVIDHAQTEKNVKALVGDGIHIVAGTYGRKIYGEIVALGKRGSELTANILGAVLKAECVRFYVDGYDFEKSYTLTYEEAVQLFMNGSVVYPPAMLPARRAGIPLEVVDFRQEGKVVVSIASSVGMAEKKGITGVVSSGPMTLFTVVGTSLLGRIGISSMIFNELSKNGVNIHFISQTMSEYSISFAVKRKLAAMAEKVLNGLVSEKSDTNDLSLIFKPVEIVSVFGQGMQNMPGISGKIYAALGNAGINVVASSQGGEELSISIVVDEANAAKAKAVLQQLY